MDKETISVTDAHQQARQFQYYISQCNHEYTYLTCLADTVAASFAGGFSSDCPGRTLVSDLTVYCCLVISVVLVTHSDEEQLTEDFTELCSGADSVLDDGGVISWVTEGFSVGWSTVTFEAGSFAGVKVEPEASGREAQICKAVSVASDRGGLSGSLVSTGADWTGPG